MSPRQAGFTLVEIAVVLLIIGLLLSGVLKGQALLDSARVKNLAQDFASIPALIHAYQDKYRALPGDDGAAVRHLCLDGSACTTAGDGNGAIDGSWHAEGETETFRLWQHLRLAELAGGSTTPTDPGYLPRNAFGGRIGVQRGGDAAALGIPGSLVVCSAGIPGKLVHQLDLGVDDGDPTSGAMRAASGEIVAPTLVSATNPLDEAGSYTVCARL
ncbi:prepilin-type N-terminal cleavage/methylation domain-containing protein [Thauera aromatica]|nr:prepilin-type N-terminal cleavage/methylation domain-containing protein [Thauera aromatica]MCK2126287.1 prepilin-type N-terminal cleavage/methylation domain-containing protein [Thauera aromatica]